MESKILTVKEWRLIKQLSIESVAKTLDISPVTYKKYEDEPSLFPMGKAKMFCDLIQEPMNAVIFLP